MRTTESGRAVNDVQHHFEQTGAVAASVKAS